MGIRYENVSADARAIHKLLPALWSDTKSIKRIQILKTAMDSSNALGNFFALPIDVRYIIWSHLGSGTSSAMCANSGVFKEIDAFLYNNLCITFDQERERGHPSSTAVPTSFGRYLKSIGPSNQELPKWIQCIPHSRVQVLTFRLFPPSLDDPGELVRKWQNITRVVDAIKQCANPTSKLKILVMEDDYQRWSADGIWNQCDSTNYLTDLETLLIPFLRLSKGKTITFETGDCFADGDMSANALSLADYISLNNSASRLQVLISDITEGISRLYADYMQSERHLQLHSALDKLPGSTAATLRRERFANWNRKYEIAHHRHICELFMAVRDPQTYWRTITFGPLSTLKDAHTRCDDFERLYHEMRAWNPCSHTLMGKPGPRDDESTWKVWEAITSQENEDFQDCFNADSWVKRYPARIPFRDSAEYREYMQKHAPPEMDRVALWRKWILLEDETDGFFGDESTGSESDCAALAEGRFRKRQPVGFSLGTGKAYFSKNGRT